MYKLSNNTLLVKPHNDIEQNKFKLIRHHIFFCHKWMLYMAMLISLWPEGWGWGEGHCSWVAKQLLFHEQVQTN